MALNYERVGWENAPSTATPIDAGSLNHMDNGILAVSKQYDVDVPHLQEQVAAIPAMLDSYLAEEIGVDVAAWLSEHVTPGGSTIVVDDTLTISGAAADSKIVGDALENKLNQSAAIGLKSVPDYIAMMMEIEIPTEQETAFNRVKSYYDNELWNTAMLRNAVLKSWITSEEYEEITGEPYEASEEEPGEPNT